MFLLAGSQTWSRGSARWEGGLIRTTRGLCHRWACAHRPATAVSVLKALSAPLIGSLPTHPGLCVLPRAIRLGSPAFPVCFLSASMTYTSLLRTLFNSCSFLDLSSHTCVAKSFHMSGQSSSDISFVLTGTTDSTLSACSKEVRGMTQSRPRPTQRKKKG